MFILLIGNIGIAQSARAADDAAELAKKLQNPIAYLISVPIKLDQDTDIGPANSDRSTFGVNTESSYNWKTADWTVPANLTVSQLVKVGKRPVSLLVGYRKYAGSLPGEQDWGMRFQVTLLFPT